MKKRILCAILTLIMLVSLVPAAALTASAASNAVSESAITVLKQLEGYSTNCGGKGSVYGYGTVCTETKAHSYHPEKEADVALRALLKNLDTAVNSFASKKGLSLTQSQHDALVLFSFANGTAWTTGTGDLQTAVANRKSGTEFLNAICRWNSSTSDDTRRMIEANMYLNGVYSTARPSRYILVNFNVNPPAGFSSTDVLMTESAAQYIDVASKPVISIVPELEYHMFLGWYTKSTNGDHVTKLTADHDGDTLYAHWQSNVAVPGENSASYEMTLESAAALYDTPNGEKSKWSVKGKVAITSEFVDEDGIKWARVGMAEKIYKSGEKKNNNVFMSVGTYTTNAWIKIGKFSVNSGSQSGSTGSMDVTVTVTNAYLRVRAEDSIYSKELRQVYQGEQLRIVNTSNGSDGFLWGQIADSDNDGVCEGWVALMYTNYNTLQEESTVNTSTAIATAVVNVNGYVNVRSDAGTDNQIVGALANGTKVDLYEIKYVNGIQWGRCKSGWFCLSYAKVSGVDTNDYVTDSAVRSYAFTGKLQSTWAIYAEPGSSEIVRLTKQMTSNEVTVSNLTNVNGVTWGKIAEGWVEVSQADGTPINVILDVAKYNVIANSVNVRDAANTGANRVDTLSKGVEFNVNDSKSGAKKQVIVVGESIWGWADKVGEENKTYGGWVNLASKYVSRGDAPTIDVKGDTTDEYTGTIATIVNADNVNVRVHGATYSKILGKIARGTVVPVLEEENGWYKIDYDVDNNAETDSWVYKDYVQISEGTISSGSGTATGGTTSGSTGKTETGLGIVANTYTGVNVRTAPGTGNAIVCKILTGTTVEILEVKTHGASKWGRVTQGWICMDYVTMVSNYEITGTTGTTGTTTGGSTTTSEVAIYSGYAINDGVKVYKTTAKNEDEVVRTLNAGDAITLHEILTVVEYEDKVVSGSTTDNNEGATTQVEKKTTYWARVNDGYIAAPGDNLALDTLDEATYTVTETDKLNVRDAAAGSLKDYKLVKGDQVTVTKLEIKNGNVWGYVELADKSNDGWVSLAYLTKGAVSVNTNTDNNTNNNNTNNGTTTTTPIIGAGSSTGGVVNNTSGYRYTGKVINTNSVNVRSTPSTSATLTTTLSSGASLVIYETTVSENMAWGRCDAGWVYLYYVDLTPVVNGAVDARVVYNDNTIAYTDMNGSSVAGTYSRMSVIDIYEIVGKMARTELGWVNTDNLL